MGTKRKEKVIVHFSCGSTSAIAGAMAIDKYGIDNIEIVYADTRSEHPDNMRFLKDCEKKLFKKKVTIVSSTKYKTIFDVFEHKRFLASPAGAPCTTEMKKIPIRDYLGPRLMECTHIFGFDAKEKLRIERYRTNNPELTVETPLFDNQITKPSCIAQLVELGIKPPRMYDLGFSNANCVGCVKAANIGYWAAIKKHFPMTFDWYAKFERQIGKKDENGVPKGASINRRTKKGVKYRYFLDQMPDTEKADGQADFWCGYGCGDNNYGENEA